MAPHRARTPVKTSDMATRPVINDRVLRKKRVLKLKMQPRAGSTHKETSESERLTENALGDAAMDETLTDDEAMAADIETDDKEARLNFFGQAPSDATQADSLSPSPAMESDSPDKGQLSMKNGGSKQPKPFAGTLAESMWAAPPKSEMVAFLDNLYEEQEKERAATRKLLSSFIGDIDAVCMKTCAEANELKNNTVQHVAGELRAFLKGTVVSRIAGSAPVTAIKPEGGKDTTNAVLSKPKVAKPKPAKPQAATEGQPSMRPSYAAMASAFTGQRLPAQSKRKDASNAKVKEPKTTAPAQPSVNPKRVYIRLAPESPRREEHPFLIVQAVNQHFPVGKGVAAASVVRSGLALTLKDGTTLSEIQARKSGIEATLGGELALDEKWMIVKIHGLPRRVTFLDDNLKLTQRDPNLDTEIMPDVISAFGVAPRTVLFRDALEKPDYLTLRLAFQVDSMVSRPTHMIVMGVRVSITYPP